MSAMLDSTHAECLLLTTATISDGKLSMQSAVQQELHERDNDHNNNN